MDKSKVMFTITELKSSTICNAIVSKAYQGPLSPILNHRKTMPYTPQIKFGPNNQQHSNTICPSRVTSFLAPLNGIMSKSVMNVLQPTVMQLNVLVPPARVNNINIGYISPVQSHFTTTRSSSPVQHERPQGVFCPEEMGSSMCSYSLI